MSHRVQIQSFWTRLHIKGCKMFARICCKSITLPVFKNLLCLQAKTDSRALFVALYGSEAVWPRFGTATQLHTKYSVCVQIAPKPTSGTRQINSTNRIPAGCSSFCLRPIKVAFQLYRTVEFLRGNVERCSDLGHWSPRCRATLTAEHQTHCYKTVPGMH